MDDTASLACVSCGAQDSRRLTMIGDDFWCLRCQISTSGRDPYHWLERSLLSNLFRSEQSCAVERLEMSDLDEAADYSKPFVTLSVEAHLIDKRTLLYKTKRAILSEEIALPPMHILHSGIEEMVIVFEDLVNAMLLLQQLKMTECMVCGDLFNIGDSAGKIMAGLACPNCAAG